MGFFTSIATKQGIISLIFVALVCFVIVKYSKNNGQANSLSTKSVVAIGIGAALYGVVSMVQIPIGPNTSLRIAVAILTVFGALFGPVVGFLVGFIGHALNDALSYGSVWWSWVFLSATIGLFAGFITLDRNFDVKGGSVSKSQIVKMYVLALIGMVAGCIIAFAGDVFLYGEPANKVWIQIILASITNYVVIAVLGIPCVIGLSKRNKKNIDIDA